jgi:nicotinamide-nucleotide amidase
MKAEILMIGTELLIGQIVDTNASYIGQTLALHGVNLYQKSTVGDNFERLTRAFDQALDRADLIITSGGLGPTEDDLTREVIAALLGRPLELQPELLERLETIFNAFGRPMTENNKKQAYLPRGAKAIDNPNGTAPGLLVEDPRGTIICMPGVPHELKAMLHDQVLPYVKERFGIEGVLHSRILRVAGMGESRVDEAIGDLIKSSQNPTVGVLASIDVVRIRITAYAATEAAAKELIVPVEAEVRDRLQGRIYGVDDDSIEGVVDELLREKGWTLAVGETSTGGLIAQRLTAAACTQFRGGCIVPPAAFNGPPMAADALAERARRETGADCGLGLAYDPDTKASHAILITPQGQSDWTTQWPRLDLHYQTRVGVTALEMVRRALVGI